MPMDPWDEEDYPFPEDDMLDVDFEGDDQDLQATYAPRVIPPTRRRPAYDRYLEHMRSQPVNKPKAWEAILAGIGGFAAGWKNADARTSMAVTTQLLNSPYQRSMGEWNAKGAELENQAKLEQDFMENERAYDTAAMAQQTAANALAVRKDQVLKGHEVAMKNAKSREESNALKKKRDEDLKLIAEQEQKLKSGQLAVDQRNAASREKEVGISQQRADAYKQSVERGGAVRPAGVKDIGEAEQQVLTELIASDPRYQQYWEIDPDYGDVVPKQDDFTPEQLREREALMVQVGMGAQSRLQGYSMGGVPPWNKRVP